MGRVPNGGNNFLKKPQIVRRRRPDYTANLNGRHDANKNICGGGLVVTT